MSFVRYNTHVCQEERAMKKFALSLLVGSMLCPCVQAQIRVEGGDGNTVEIGPNGIQLNAPANGGTNLHIGPGGINGVAGGNTRLNLSPGRGTIKTSGNTSRHSTTH